MCLHLSRAGRARLLPRLLAATVPWLTCHAHNARTFAQLVLYALLEQLPEGEGVCTPMEGVCGCMFQTCNAQT